MQNPLRSSFVFFKQKTAYEMRISDWSSDVCSSDLSSNPADVPTTPGATGQLLTFSVTNNGNGVEAFGLTTIASAGGDGYDPAVTQIYIDNGDGLFDAGTDTLYTPGANDPSLNPDQGVTVFVLATTPGSVADGNRGIVSLVAAAETGT